MKFILKTLFHISFVTFALVEVVGPLALNNASVINGALGIETQIGGGTISEGNIYYNTKFNNMKEVKEASWDIIEETMEEGAVLLKNDNDALPLAKGDAVNLYGMASYHSVHSGQGSSGIESSSALSDRVTLYQGLTDAGLNVNADLNSWYAAQNVSSVMGGGNFIGGSSQQSQYLVKDVAWSGLPSSKTKEAKAGVVVFARNSGEAVDLYMDTTMDDGETRVVLNKYDSSPSNSVGDALVLTDNEKSVLEGMKQLKQEGTIDKIVVLLNCASPMQSAFLEDSKYDVDACMWVGTLGSNGASAIGKLLTGEKNPSGKTSDTFWADNQYNPVYYNFGSMQYANSSILKDYFNNLSSANNRFYVAYQEGIYNGYKYTETRYEDVVMNRANAGTFDYKAAVSYPFGYGLSYTNFTYSNMNVTENADDTYTVSVDVTNNTAREGKEAVQIYLQKPYTQKDVQNGVEKSAVELVGFTKVTVPGNGKVTATVKVEGKYFAAYDANGEKTFVVGSADSKDKYLLTAAKDSHDAINNILRYKKENGSQIDESKMFYNAERGTGDQALVWGKYIAYNTTKYATNDIIESENENFTPQYEGQQANYGVSSITNQFDDVDFKKANLFSTTEADQTYLSRNNWTGTYGKRIQLTATDALKEAQKNPVVEQDNIPYPTYDELEFYETSEGFEEMKLIYLRGKDYNDEMWDTLLNRMTWDETCYILQEGLRFTRGVESIAAPSTSQQNGALAPVHARTYGQLPSQNGFRGFSETLDPENKSQLPAVFLCNGLVASTYNLDLIERLGEQTGEECIWAGFNGIYGLGVNIHRGAYCGRTFEYYSEDGFLTGMAAGYEAVGLHKLGVFVLAKHAVLNDQETHRAGLNVWANEQTIREIYCRALEVAIAVDREFTPAPMLGVMTGMNRMGAKWTGGQGFCNTVLRAEYGMRGYAVSDYNSSRVYMSPIQGVLYGNDLPDGAPAGGNGGYDKDGNDIRFTSYATGYGKLAWSMRTAAKNILYTVVNSNAMNGVTGDTTVTVITPAWEILMPAFQRVIFTVFVWASVAFAVVWTIDFFSSFMKKPKLLNGNKRVK